MKLSIKRLLAYLIDMAVVFVLFLMVGAFVKPNIYEQKLKELNEQYVLKNVDFKQYKDEYITITQEIDKSNFSVNLVTTIFIIIVFIIIPYFKNGQTIGLAIMKIEINKKNLSSLFIRSLIVNGLGYMLLMFSILFLVNDSIYFVLINFWLLPNFTSNYKWFYDII